MKRIPVYNIDTLSYQSQDVSGFKIQRFEEQLKGIDEVRFPHRHDFYYMLYIREGKGTHTIDFADYPIRPGQLFFMSPGQIHEWRLSDRMVGYAVFFNKVFFDDLTAGAPALSFFHNLFTKPLISVSAKTRATVERWMEQLIEEQGSAGPYRAEVLRGIFSAFLFKLKGEYGGAEEPSHSGRSAELVRTFELLLEQHYRDYKHIEDYAEHMHVSPNYLNAVCKEITGRSAKQLYNEQLLLESKRLLKHSNFSIQEIVDYLGFSDTAYFSRFFRKLQNTTPLKFRTGVE